MRTLYTTTINDLDISTLTSISSYDVESTMYICVLVSVSNISGNFNYLARLYSDDALLCPDRPVFIDSISSIQLQSKAILALVNSTVSIKVLGSPTDTNATVKIVIVDVSPVYIDEISNQLIPDVVNVTKSTIEDTIDGIQIVVKPETKVLRPQSDNISHPILPLARQVVSPIH